MPETANANGSRILLVTGSLVRGGTEQQLVGVASALLRRGWRVMVFSLASGPLARELETNGVPLILARGQLGSRRGFSPQRLMRLAFAAGHLFGIMLSRRPEIVHFFLPETYLLGAPLAILARRPLRVMSRRSLNLYQRGYPDFVARLERRLHSTMTAILGNSRSVVRELRESEGVDPRRLGLIYNGVDMTRFGNRHRRAVREVLGLPPDVLLLVTVANLIPYKGHHDLLRAVGAAKAQLPNGWRLLLVGRDDGIQCDLQGETEALGISDHVIFLGERSDVPDILEAGDIGILCSHQEGFSNAVLEGMAAGLAMVVTDVGGNPEAVIDGESGLVVPPRNPARLADAILRVAGDEALRARLGAAGRARVMAEFSLARCVERYDALYHALLAGRLPQDLPDIWVEGR